MIDADARSAARRARSIALVVGGVALTIVAVLSLRADDQVTSIAPPSAHERTTVGSGAPGISSFGPGMRPDGAPIGIPLSSGFAGDRFRWALYAEGPSRNLCLAVQSTFSSEPDRGATTCGQPPSDGSAHDSNRPLVLRGSRVPAFVFGRMPTDVAQVSVVLSDGAKLGRKAPAQTPIGQFYAVELPDRKNLRAVVGHRKDGTSVRYEY